LEQILLVLMVFLGLWAIVMLAYRLLNLKRYGFSLKPLLLIARSRRVAEKLQAVGFANSRTWKVVSSIGVLVSGGLTVFAFYFLITNLLARIARPSQPSLYVIVPGVTIGWEAVPYFLVAATITITVHEAFHAITFGSERVPIKSFGFFLAAILLGGFVEADEEAFKNSKPLSKIRVYASGSFSNFLVFLLAIALSVLTISSSPQGVLVLDTQEGYPAHEVLKSWDVIVAIDHREIRNISDLNAVLSSTAPGTEINVTILRNGESVVLRLRTTSHLKNSSRSYLGVGISDYYPPTIPWLRGQAYLYWTSTLYWLTILSFSVAMINMLPIPLLDGSGFVKALLEGPLRNNKKLIELIANALGALSLFLLIANIGLPTS
jgi:membrane-associated protease RseP (regulator of RpoE activity)